jgi:hypothetical protein
VLVHKLFEVGLPPAVHISRCYLSIRRGTRHRMQRVTKSGRKSSGDCYSGSLVLVAQPPDADRNRNALSSPFVVGPHGRIFKLNPHALAPGRSDP